MCAIKMQVMQVNEQPAEVPNSMIVPSHLLIDLPTITQNPVMYY